jgi:hypothetical protein
MLFMVLTAKTSRCNPRKFYKKNLDGIRMVYSTFQAMRCADAKCPCDMYVLHDASSLFPLAPSSANFVGWRFPTCMLVVRCSGELQRGVTSRVTAAQLAGSRQNYRMTATTASSACTTIIPSGSAANRLPDGYPRSPHSGSWVSMTFKALGDVKRLPFFW